MSRIGKLPIKVPAGVTVDKKPGNMVHVKGPKGELSISLNPRIDIEINDGVIVVKKHDESQSSRSLHGLSRTLISNMIEGVTKGFEKKLDIQGVGYRATLQGSKLVLNLGHSHPIEVTPPKGIMIQIDAEKKNILTVSGADKQLVGEMSAKIRSLKKPEPYKGKGIRYSDEVVVIKETKKK